jgi:hypothetical protein
MLSLTYLLTFLRSWALPEKLPIVQPLKNIPAFYETRIVHYRVHKSPSLVPILSQIDPVHTIPYCLSKIYFNIVHIYVLVFLVVSFLLAFPPISYMHSSSSPFVLHALPISFSLKDPAVGVGTLMLNGSLNKEKNGQVRPAKSSSRAFASLEDIRDV